MELDVAFVVWPGTSSATEAYVAAADRSGPDARWPHEIGFVEHHHNNHVVLRGTFAGHYVDVDEALHVSERGTAEGFVGGALVGVLLGPPGIAFGMVFGATVGSQLGQRSEADPEPQVLVEQLRTGVPRGSSAMVLIAPAADVDDMLAAIGEGRGVLTRRSLTADQAAALQASVGSTPIASPGPSKAGEVAVEASESETT
jgi:uncharacterized membrane protein